MAELTATLAAALAMAWERISAVDIALILGCSVTLLLSRRIVDTFSEGTETRTAIRRMLRAGMWLLILILIAYDVVIPLEQTFITRLLAVALISLLAYLAFIVASGVIRHRFGAFRQVHGEQQLTDTYNSRLLSIVAGVVIFSIALVAIIQVFGFDRLLHAGGAFGVIGVMLALTQASWAPDLVGGLLLLNSRMIEPDDVVELTDGEPIIGVVFRTKMFHTELLDVSRNIRVMIQNSRLRSSTIRNLSKFASSAGLRECLTYNIGYDVPQKRVHKLFETAFENLKESAEIPLEFDRGFEIRASEAGDYAVRWAFYYRLKDVRQLIFVRQMVNAEVLRVAAEQNVTLATPILLTTQTATVPPAERAAVRAVSGQAPGAAGRSES